jgi:hypothetical protein
MWGLRAQIKELRAALHVIEIEGYDALDRSHGVVTLRGEIKDLIKIARKALDKRD